MPGRMTRGPEGAEAYARDLQLWSVGESQG
jgi:hypothetical protein